MDHASCLTCLSLSSIFSSNEANPNVFPFYAVLLLRFQMKPPTGCSFYSGFLSVISAIPHTYFAPSTPQTQQHSRCFISLFTFPHGALGGITLAVTQSFLNNLDMTSGLQYHHTDNAPQASTVTPGLHHGITL